MTASRKICIVTGSRAEYGLLYWLIREIAETPGLSVQLLVTGMHLSPEFGLTVRDIERDGIEIADRVEMLLSSDTPVGTAKSIGVGLLAFADAYARLAPDIIVVLGDRFEILAAVTAALPLRIPVAHIHGGEITEGAIDESIRHAITKLSHLHFVAAESYRQRVIQMGELPERVFLVGAPGLDHITRTTRLGRTQLEANLGITLGDTNFLVTYHPATLGGVVPVKAFGELLAAFAQFPHARIVFTRPNADAEGRALNVLIDAFVEQNVGRAWVFTSLGQLRYLSLMACADAVIGNSSSGLTEAPLLRVPTVNIGPRQDGRLKAPSVIDCGETAGEIAAAIERANGSEHRGVCARGESLYGYGDASGKIRDILATWPLENLGTKPFFDIPAMQQGSLS